MIGIIYLAAFVVNANSVAINILKSLILSSVLQVLIRYTGCAFTGTLTIVIAHAGQGSRKMYFLFAVFEFLIKIENIYNI